MARPAHHTEEGVRELVAASPDALLLFTRVGDPGAAAGFALTELNSQAEQFLGCPRDRAIGVTLETLLPDAPAGLVDTCRTVLQTGEPHEEDAELTDGAGVSRSVRRRVARVGTGVAITICDLTEVRRTEASLRESEERFRRIVEDATDGIYRIDPRGIFLYANPVVSRVLGVAGESVVGRLYLDFVRPDHRMEAIELYSRQIRDRIPLTYWEFPALRADGREVWIGQNVQVELEGDEVTALFAVARDVTARRATEEALRESEARHRFLAEHSTDMLVRVDRNGRLTYVSPVCRALLGYEPEEMIGRGIDAVCHPDDLAAAREAHARVAATGGVETGTVRMRRKDGTEVPFEITRQGIVEPDTREVSGIFAIARDITERRRLEEELRHAQKMEAVGQLAGGVAHDFNNLLTAIRGFSDVLFESIRPDDPRRADVLEICKATDRAATLTRQLLAFSRRQVLRPEPLSLNTIAADLARILARLLGERITVRTQFDPALGTVMADPGQLEQVLLNLALNARDAMSERGGVLTIETADVVVDADRDRHRAPGRYAALRVSDEGHGMSPEVRERLFEPFFTTKQRGKGTGLGLSMAYGIVTQSGGFITVDSAPGQGATFTIHLPVADRQPDRTRQTPPRVHPVTSGTGTILVAEDSDGVLALAERILVQAGYTVLTARDGAEALEISRGYAGTIDLLLTDVMMPYMNGGELARVFSVERPDAAVALMSGYVDEAALRRTLDDPDVPILHKPFSATTLLERVRAILVTDERA